jgi:hypothetical protein
MELVEDAGGDPRNARFLATASDLAYLPQDKGAAEFESLLGLKATLISFDNTQAYVATNDDHIVVAFRGTEAPGSLEGLKDWLLTDAVNLLIVPKGRMGTDLAAAGVGARFHQGFVDALSEIWPAVHSAIEAEMNQSDRPLWLTGHSLGGALALLAAWMFHRKFISVHQVYTFGAPMIGNRDACQAIDRELKGKIFRYVNTTDPVPKLPTISLIANSYGHVEREVALGSAASDLFQGFAALAVDGLLNATLIDELWKQVSGLVSAHQMPSYHGLLKSL